MSTALFSSGASQVSANQQHSPPAWPALRKNPPRISAAAAVAPSNLPRRPDGRCLDTPIHIFQTLATPSPAGRTLGARRGCRPASKSCKHTSVGAAATISMTASLAQGFSVCPFDSLWISRTLCFPPCFAAQVSSPMTKQMN